MKNKNNGIRKLTFKLPNPKNCKVLVHYKDIEHDEKGYVIIDGKRFYPLNKL